MRKPRRVQVQFWRRGESQASPGYTTNISTTGMFLATTSPQPPGTRLRIEVMDGHHGFMVEGLVAHARKVRGDMMRITHPGMGIRFLSVTELVRELIPVLPGETEEIPEEERMWGEEGSPSMAKPGSATSAMKPPEPVRPVAAASAPPASPSVSPPVSPSIGRPVTAGVRASGTYPKPVEAAGAFTVQFLGPAEFVQVFERDIVNGGLFVSTRYPGRLQEVINVEILPPLPHAEPVSFRARVVQRFEPHGNDFGPNLLSGMGVEIIDLPALLVRLLPEIARAKSLSSG